MLFLRNLCVENFLGFRGIHDFTFKRGLNVVEGPVGSGKTGLCRAIEFAFFGAAWGLGGAEGSGLVNRGFKEGCLGRRYPGCEVKLTFEYEGDELRVERSFRETDYDMVSEDVYYSSGIRPRLSRDQFHDTIYFNGDMLDSMHEGSEGVLVARLSQYLRHRIQRNLVEGIGSLILDGALSGLSPELRTSLLRDLEDSDVEQVLIFEPPGTLEGCFGDCEVRTFFLGEVLKSVRVRLHDFPFSQEALLDRLTFLFENSYLFKGARYSQYVYDHDYIVEVYDVDRSGGRFVSGKTEVYFV